MRRQRSFRLAFSVLRHLRGDEGGEVGRRLEVLVDRGVANEGHRIEIAEAFHQHLADVGCPDLGFAHVLEAANDAGDHVVELLLADWTFLQGYRDRTAQLVAVEGGAATITLDDDEIAKLDALERGEATATVCAAATAADGRVLFGRPTVLDDRVSSSAIRTAQTSPLEHQPHGAA